MEWGTIRTSTRGVKCPLRKWQETEWRSRHVERLQDDASPSINRVESLSDSTCECARMQGRKTDTGISYRDLKRHNRLWFPPFSPWSKVGYKRPAVLIKGFSMAQKEELGSLKIKLKTLMWAKKEQGLRYDEFQSLIYADIRHTFGICEHTVNIIQCFLPSFFSVCSNWHFHEVTNRAG